MKPDTAVTHDSIRSRVRTVLESMPERAGDRDEWFEQALETVCAPFDELSEQVNHLISANDLLQLENKRLQERLAGHRAVESSFQQRAEEFRTLAENSPDLILRLGRDLCIQYINPAASSLLNVSGEEMIGQPIMEMEAYQPVADRMPDLSTAFKTGEAQRFEIAYPADTLLRFDIRITPEKGAGEQVESLLLVARDITQYKLLEEENERQKISLAHERRLLETIFVADPGGIAVVSGADYVYQMANDAYRAVLPHPEINPIGHTMDELWSSAEGFQGSLLVKPVVEEQASLTIERLQRRYPDGDLRTFTFHVRPIDWNGRPSILIVTWETTQLEKALEKAEEGQRMLDALMEYIPEGITVSSSLDLRVLYTSKYAAGMVSRKRKDIEGISLDRYAKYLRLNRADGIIPWMRRSFLRSGPHSSAR